MVGSRVVEAQLTGFDHLHHLRCHHGLRDAGNGELIVDGDVAFAVCLAGCPAPGAVRPHDRGRDPRSVGQVVQDCLQFSRHLVGGGLLTDPRED